jgi:hypothetical protein
MMHWHLQNKEEHCGLYGTHNCENVSGSVRYAGNTTVFRRPRPPISPFVIVCSLCLTLQEKTVLIVFEIS